MVDMRPQPNGDRGIFAQKLNDWISTVIKSTGGLRDDIVIAVRDGLALQTDMDQVQEDVNTLDMVTTTQGGKITILEGEMDDVEEDITTIEGDITLLENSPARVSAYRYGVRSGTGTAQNASLHAAFAAAELMGGGRQVELPPGPITIDGSFSLSGYSSGLIGTGSTTLTGPYPPGSGTVLVCVDQDGPVLDFDGFIPPRAQKGRVLFSDFSIEGDGVVGSANKGIYLGGTPGGSGIDFQRIIISNTGGVGLHVKDDYLADFYGVVVFDPVDCAAQDTPYVLLEGANGNRFFGLGFRSSNHDDEAGDVGPSGALRLTGALANFHNTTFYGTWFENQHVPEDGTLIDTRANHVIFNDTQFFDVKRVPGASGTSYARFNEADINDHGGMTWRGLVPGNGQSGVDYLVETGIEIYQDGAHIVGTKGYRGNNVLLGAGVNYCFVMLGGGMYANSGAFTDNSGTTTNTLIDAMRGIWMIGAQNNSSASMSMAGLEQLDKHTSPATTSGSATINMSTGNNVFNYSLTGNMTINATTYTGGAGRDLYVIFTQDGVGNHTVAWHSSFNFARGITPVVNPAANAVTAFHFKRTAAGNWQEIGSPAPFARANHTGTQAISTITNLQAALDSLALRPVRTEVANYTLLATDYSIRVDATSAPVTITLPATVVGAVYEIVKIDATANAVTVDGDGTDVINVPGTGPEATVDLQDQYAMLILKCFAANEWTWISAVGTVV